MRAPAPAVCIVIPGYIASTPRAVREADALVEAEYRVRVVSTQGDIDRLRENDATVHGRRGWSWNAVRWSRRRPAERQTFWWSTARQRLAAGAPARAARYRGLAERAEGRVFPELARLAAREPAALYIGHYPAGLAAAAAAAERHDAALAYDLEDLHTAECEATRAGDARCARIDVIERRYVGRCAYLTASSRGIAEGFSARYGVAMPSLVHNVGSWRERGEADGLVKDRKGKALSLFWFSQTVGHNRGLEHVIRAVAEARGGVQLHVRGTLPEGVGHDLMATAAECGVAECLHFHPQVPPDELLSRAMEHDVGLCLEQGHTANNLLAAANKMFTYMLAGLAVVATDTPGQLAIGSETPDAVRFVPRGASAPLARTIADWRDDPALLAQARAAALGAARTRWNWERESRALVALVDRATGRAPANA